MKIIFNGAEYEGIEQMPAEVRSEYLKVVNFLGDADRDGVPDALQKPGVASVISHEHFVFNGREYKSLDELPAEVREALARLPPKPAGTPQNLMEVISHSPPIQKEVSVSWTVGDTAAGHGSARGRGGWIAFLCLVIVVLLFLWLSGIRPSQLWGK